MCRPVSEEQTSSNKTIQGRCHIVARCRRGNPAARHDTHVSLHRSKMGRVDRMIKSGRFDDLYREFKAVAPSTQSEYFMMEAGRKVGPQEIEDLAKLLGIVGQR